MKILLSILFNACILFALTFLLGGDNVKGVNEGIIVTGGLSTYLIGGTVLGLINITIKPVLKILSFPLFFVFFGLVSIVINGVILFLLEYIINVFLNIDGFTYKIAGEQFSMHWWINFIIAIAIFSVLNMIYSLLFKK